MPRVVTSDAAVQLIDRLRIEIDGVRESLDTMLRTGNELAMPEVWEGAAANQFRDGDWADTQRWAMDAVARLEDLRGTVERINHGIGEAGGGLG